MIDLLCEGRGLVQCTLQAEFERPEPPFATKLVSDLLPEASRRKYLEITMRALRP